MGRRRVTAAQPRWTAPLRAGLFALLFLGMTAPVAMAQSFRIARVQYGGDGDWYGDERAIETLLAYTRVHTLLDVPLKEDAVTLLDERLFDYNVLYIVGHGNIEFTAEEARRLRRYLDAGGFLIANDDYGFDVALQREMAKVFPEQPFAEIPYEHPLFSAHYTFASGLPKIHEHDGKRPQALGLTCEGGRLCVFYNVETDLGDGWNPEGVHDDPPEAREAALQMGVNLLAYALTR